MGIIDMLQGLVSDPDLPKFKDQNYDEVSLEAFFNLVRINIALRV